MSEPFAAPKDIDLHCPECDYNLTGITSDRCPWCGWVIDADALAAAITASASWRRWAAVFAALTLGFVSLMAMSALVKRGGPLAWRDGLAVAAVSVGAVGHFVLAVFAIAGGKRWTVRFRESSGVLRWMGWFSVGAAVFGATAMLQDTRIVRGVTVNAAFEFLLAATFFSMPGWTLLALRLVLFDDGKFRGRRRDEAATAQHTIPFAIEIHECYRRDQITQAWTDAKRPTNSEVEGAIARIWEAEKALAETSGRDLYDGELIRLVRAEAVPTCLHLELGPTRYREFLGTNARELEEPGHIEMSCLANPIGISATVITSDGFLGFGRRSDRVTLHAGYLHSIGGMLEAKDRTADGDCDVFGAIEREIVEELGIEPGHIEEVIMVGLARDRRLLQPEFLFDATLRLSRVEVERLFDPALSDGEHSGLEWVCDEPDAVVPFLALMAPVAPVAEAALLLHGRRNWGAQWFENTCYLRYGELPPTGAVRAYPTFAHAERMA